MTSYSNHLVSLSDASKTSTLKTKTKISTNPQDQDQDQELMRKQVSDQGQDQDLIHWYHYYKGSRPTCTVYMCKQQSLIFHQLRIITGISLD